MTDSPNTPREFNDDSLDHVWDEPRVTSYVMHELADEELQAFEAELDADPALQLAVQQAREITTELESVFAVPSSSEAGPLKLEPERKEAILAATQWGNSPPTNNIEPSSSRGRSRALRLVITLLASAAAIIIVLNVAPRYTDFDMAEYNVKQAVEPLARDLAGNAPPAGANETPQATPPESTAGAELADTKAPSTKAVAADVTALDAEDERLIGEMKDEPTTKPPALGGARMGAARSLNVPAEAATETMAEESEGNGQPEGNTESVSRSAKTAPAAVSPMMRSMPAADLPGNVPPSGAVPMAVQPSAAPPQADTEAPRASQPPTPAMGAQMAAPRRTEKATSTESTQKEPARGDADALGPAGSGSAGFGSANFADAGPMKPDAENPADKPADKPTGELADKSETRPLGREPLAMNSLQQTRPRSSVLPMPNAAPGDGEPSEAQPPSVPAGDALPTVQDLFGGGSDPQAMRQQAQQPAPTQSQNGQESGQQAAFGIPKNVNRRAIKPTPEERSNGTAEMEADFAESTSTPNANDRKFAPKDEGQQTEAVPDGSRYANIARNPFISAKQHPESTFLVDVDTASYTKVRQLLRHHTRPRRDAVRIEEMVNYFEYDYQAPQQEEPHPFRADVSIAECPWYDGHQLARVAIQGRRISNQQRPACNLVFLLDTSGSMSEPNKLPLVVFGMKSLTKQLRPDDRVTIVTYAGSAGVAVNGAKGDQREKIISKLDSLTAAGRTNGSQGIKLAYDSARNHFVEGGVNRVILCSDGDFNVGMTDDDALVSLIKEQASSGVFLTALGFGMDNHNDAMMEKISGAGNGNYAFINSQAESTKVLGKELNSTLVTIAKDVKLQIKFDPKQIAQYRLIGYENRRLAAGDLHNDKKDGGDIGAGHQVTAFYELIPTGPNQPTATPMILPATADGNAAANAAPAESDPPEDETEPPESDQNAGNAMTVLLSYKQPDEGIGQTLEIGVNPVVVPFGDADQDFRFAASVASFGMQLRSLRSSDTNKAGTWNLKDVIRTAKGSMEKDRYELKAEFVELVEIADKLNADRQ